MLVTITNSQDYSSPQPSAANKKLIVQPATLLAFFKSEEEIMKFHLNTRRLAHFWSLALFSWVGGQWLLVYAGWTQPWMAYSVSCTAVTQLSNLILKLLLADNDENNDHQAKDNNAEIAPKDRSVRNKKKNKNKKINGKRDATD